LTQYDMVVIDEALQLSKEQLERVDEMFIAAGRQPCVLLLGDKWQLPSIDPQRACDSPKWKLVKEVALVQSWRCKCPVLGAKLAALRTTRPMGRQGAHLVARICRGHKAWSRHHEPTLDDVRDVLARTDTPTTFVTGTTRGAALLNDLVLEALFGNGLGRRLGTVPADYERNGANYDDFNKLLEDVAPEPSELTVFRGMRVVLTRNLNKAAHFVNGMVATVEAYDADVHCVRVLTSTGRRLAVYPYTDTDVPVGRVTYFPLRAGYASTIYKFQGAELSHVTVWLDRPGCPAAAYVALSRVQRDADYLIGGRVTKAHFTPAM
jgi:ATP-dependent exoDNAse (exonuclease V) alpha subunit